MRPLLLLLSFLALAGCASIDEASGVWNINSFSRLGKKAGDHDTRWLPP